LLRFFNFPFPPEAEPTNEEQKEAA
jgi:hypothetical protein